MRALALGGLAFISFCYVTPSSAQSTDQGVKSVATLADHCLKFGPDITAIAYAANNDPNWQVDTSASIDAKAFDKVPSMPAMYWYDKPVQITVWVERAANPLRLIVGKFGKKNDIGLCAVVASNIDNAIPYFDAFDAVMKSGGLKRKSTDLPHYLQYSGKTADGHYLRGDIFSRSFVTGEKKSMHLAYGFSIE
jgi:hypothetical protein